MSHKPVVLTARARLEVRQITAWYRKEGGAVLALRWASSMESAIRHIGTHPKTGSTRYATLLKLDSLRFWPIRDFPYLIFYLERDTHIDAWRVLHAQRDIPEWMGSHE